MSKELRLGAFLLILGIVIAPPSYGGGASRPPDPQGAAPSGTLSAFLTDTPVDGATASPADPSAVDVVAFCIDVTGATLVGSNGSSVNILSGVKQIEIRHLELIPTVAFQTNNAPSGNYATLNMTFARPEITRIGADGKVTILNASSSPSVLLDTDTASLSQSVNLTLYANQAAGLILDFDLRRSIRVDANGNYIVKPVVNIGLPGSLPTDFHLEDASGTIISIPVAGTLDLQLRDTGQVVRVVTNANTVFAAQEERVETLQAGQSISVYAQFQYNGNFLADRIDVLTSDTVLSSFGVVTGISRYPSGEASLQLIALH